jgi:hypothetical protein
VHQPFLADPATGPAGGEVRQAAGQSQHPCWLSDVDAGDRRIARVIGTLRKSPQSGKMLIVITLDRNAD